MARFGYRCRWITVGLLIAGTFSACDKGAAPPAKLAGIIVITDLYGNADDGDSTTLASPESHQYRNPATTVSDGQSGASSDGVLFDQVGGHVHAIPGPHATTRSVANSNSRLETELDVNDSGLYSFVLTLSLNGCAVSGGGTLGVFIRSNVLDDSGLVVQGGAISFLDMAVTADAKKLIVAGDSAHAIAFDAGGKLLHAFAGPIGGVRLKKGIYHLAINLRLDAAAPPQSARAEIAAATLTIAVKQGAPSTP